MIEWGSRMPRLKASLTRFTRILVATVPLASGLVSCSTFVPLPPRQADRVLYEWHGDGVPGKFAIRIHLEEQRAYFFRGEQEVGWCFVATGKEGYGTRPGRYSITEKVVDKHSTIYGIIEDEFGNEIDGDARVGREAIPKGARFVHAPMPYWMRLTSYGIGMHAGKIPQPGEPASHGCIRLPREMAEIVYENAPMGTPVTIVR